MKVAFSKINITPKDYIGKPMAGYARKNPCQGNLDDIYAYGVLIESVYNNKESNRLLLISVDTLKLPLSIVEYIKSRLISNYNTLKKKYILIHATHTHSSFDLTGEFYYPGGTFSFLKGVMFASNKNDRYIVWLTDRIVKMVNTLFKDLKSCMISWKREKFNPKIVINRRHPSRKTIPDLGVLSFKSDDSKELMGIIINYACHPTTLSYKNNKLSADYPGRVIAKIDELSNKRIKAIYFNGPSGDLNPITTCGTDFEKIDKDKTLVYDQLGTYMNTKKIGNIIGEEAFNLAKSIDEKNYFKDIQIEINEQEVLIPFKDLKYFSKVWLSNKLKWIIKKYFLFKIAKFDPNHVNFPIFILDRKRLSKFGRTLIQLINFKTPSSNGFSILSIPGELFEDIGKNLIKNSPKGKQNTFIFQNSQDWIGYLFPLDLYVEEGGYEPFMCFSPLCGYYIEIETLKLLKRLKK